MERGNSKTTVKVGDTVRVLGRIGDERDIRGLQYNNQMDKYIGCISEISSVEWGYTESGPCVTLDIDHDWYWVPDWLDFEAEEQQPSLDDMENAWRCEIEYI